MENQKIVITLSGGADSTLAAVLTKERWPNAEYYPVFINYNQICANQEHKIAFHIARRLDFLGLHTIYIQNVWTSGGMIDGEDEINDVYTPVRNLALLSCTIAYAESIHADIIVTGSKGHSKIPDEKHSYYDSTIPFAKMMESIWYYASEDKRTVQIIPILAEGRKETMSKKEVYQRLQEYNILETWSCFRGGPTECGICSNCIEKAKIYEELALDEKRDNSPCCDSPEKNKCDQCQETGIANPHNH